MEKARKEAQRGGRRSNEEEEVREMVRDLAMGVRKVAQPVVSQKR